jgi:hypothetical protein
VRSRDLALAVGMLFFELSFLFLNNSGAVTRACPGDDGFR